MKQLSTHEKQNSITLTYKTIGVIVALAILSHAFTFYLLSHSLTGKTSVEQIRNKAPSLYLLDQAAKYVYDLHSFEDKVKEVSRKLNVPAAWLMAVIHSESRFDASVKNHKGSGAVGLIQFMPTTAADMNITVEKLRNMNHTEQLELTYRYLNEKRKTYRDFETLTDLYLAILYPKALEHEYCYSLYEAPSKAYKQNIGLDQDKDGRVTIQDIDKYLQKKYPSAFVLAKNGTNKSDTEHGRQLGNLFSY